MILHTIMLSIQSYMFLRSLFQCNQKMKNLGHKLQSNREKKLVRIAKIKRINVFFS